MTISGRYFSKKMCIRDRDYDMIAPVPENMYVPVRSHYQNAPHHHIKDLELITEIVKSRSPALYPVSYTHLDVYKRQTTLWSGCT